MFLRKNSRIVASVSLWRAIVRNLFDVYVARICMVLVLLHLYRLIRCNRDELLSNAGDVRHISAWWIPSTRGSCRLRKYMNSFVVNLEILVQTNIR